MRERSGSGGYAISIVSVAPQPRKDAKVQILIGRMPPPGGIRPDNRRAIFTCKYAAYSLIRIGFETAASHRATEDASEVE